VTVFKALGIHFFSPPRPERGERDEDDLTTLPLRPGKIHPDSLTIVPPQAHWFTPDRPVPGRCVFGTHPEDPHARFVLRMPEDWNGAIVVSAAPGLISEFGCDLYWSDFCLTNGFAFASTDKGAAMTAGREQAFVSLAPESLLPRWYGRLKGLGELAKREASSFYGRAPEKLYAVGVSNGGYLARRAVEADPELFDGAVEVSGVLWRADGPNLLEQLPGALRAAGGSAVDASALFEAGFTVPEGWDAVLGYYRSPFWELVLRYFIGTFDPAYDGVLEDYDLKARPGPVREAIAAVENTGELGRPLFSLVGTGDLMLPPRFHSEAYRELVKSRGKGALHTVRIIENASHNDMDKAVFPFIEPLMPHAHAALLDLSHLPTPA